MLLASVHLVTHPVPLATCYLLLITLVTRHTSGGGCCRGECAAYGGGPQQQRQHGQQPVRRKHSHALWCTGGSAGRAHIHDGVIPHLEDIIYGINYCLTGAPVWRGRCLLVWCFMYVYLCGLLDVTVLSAYVLCVGVCFWAWKTPAGFVVGEPGSCYRGSQGSIRYSCRLWCCLVLLTCVCIRASPSIWYFLGGRLLPDRTFYSISALTVQYSRCTIC